MADISQPAFDLHNTYVHLEDGGGARHIPVGPDFWAKIGERADLQRCRSARLVRDAMAALPMPPVRSAAG